MASDSGGTGGSECGGAMMGDVGKHGGWMGFCWILFYFFSFL